VARWAKKPGEPVKKDEVLVELETDKVNLEVAASEDGVLADIAAEEGATVEPGQVLGHIGAAGAAPAKAPVQLAAAEAKTPEPAMAGAAPAAEARAAPPPAAPTPAPARPAEPERPLAPSVQRIVAENKLDPAVIAATGKDGRAPRPPPRRRRPLLPRPERLRRQPPRVPISRARSGCA
jgi:2-oxoglutarate dehydrogenase E2 component (dihydrolipoamide succinyltransferase)